MSEANLTRWALAQSLKRLLETQPFERVRVSDICAQCGLNRKSFYYHFRDKWDLVTWIFDAECLGAYENIEKDRQWPMLEIMCAHFYENRAFYRRTLSVEGQNSFSGHFHDVVASAMERELNPEFRAQEGIDVAFCVDFYADAFVCAVKRWLLNRDCMTGEAFAQNVRRCLVGTTQRLLRESPNRKMPADAGNVSRQKTMFFDGGEPVS